MPDEHISSARPSRRALNAMPLAAARTPLSMHDKRSLLRLLIAGLLGTSALAIASGAQARITKIAILSSGSAFGGYSFAGVGTYQALRGYAIDAVDPSDPQNAAITEHADGRRCRTVKLRSEHCGCPTSYGWPSSGGGFGRRIDQRSRKPFAGCLLLRSL